MSSPVPERFELGRCLGSGGMGVVYEAYDRHRDEVVALKTLRRVEPDSIYRLKREFRSLADLAHPNLVALHDLYSVAPHWFFTMELIHGADFLAYVRPGGEARVPGLSADGSTTPLASAAPIGARPVSSLRLSELRQSLTQLVEGVQALHSAGKLHRDIKPSNILVTAGGRVVLLDFGLVGDIRHSRALDDDEDDDDGDGDGGNQGEDENGADPCFYGTLAYVAPEQCAGRPVGPAADWYAVGSILYEALTGRVPYLGVAPQVIRDKQIAEPAPPRALDPALPSDLSDLCTELLRLDPRARPTGEEVLRRVGRGEVVSLEAKGSALVGRRAELESLEAAYASVASRGVAVLIRGSSGIGKTALVRRFLDGLGRREPVLILEGKCYEREILPHNAVDGLIDALAQYLALLPPERRAGLLAPGIEALATMFPVLARVPRLPLRATEGDLEPLDRWRRGVSALREILARLARTKRLVLFIDDLQWGDQDSARLLAELFRGSDPPRLLLLGCYRSEQAGAVQRLLSRLRPVGGGQAGGLELREITLGPLLPEEARDLVRMNSPALRGELVEEILQESGCSPFFIQTLVSHLESGADTDRASGGLSRVRLDETLSERLDGLSPSARPLLQAVAVFGGPVTESVAVRAVGLRPEERGLVRSLKMARFLRATALGEHQGIEIYHDRIREALVSRLGAGERTDVHRRLAGALEAEADVDAETLLFHLQAAGERDKAAQHAAVAAERATGSLAFDRAARLYRLALELRTDAGPPRLALQRGLASALAAGGSGVEAAEAFLAAVPSARTSGPGLAESVDLRCLSAQHFFLSGHRDRGLGVLRSLLEEAAMARPGSRVAAWISLLHWRARLALRGLAFRLRELPEVRCEILNRIEICWTAIVGVGMSDLVWAAAYQSRHLHLALEAGEPYRIARALFVQVTFESASPGDAGPRVRRLLGVAKALAGRAVGLQAQHLLRCTFGLGHYLLGEWAAARDQLEQAEALFQTSEPVSAWVRTIVQICLLWSLFYMGEIRELALRLDAAQKEFDQYGTSHAALSLVSQAAVVGLLARDRAEEARLTLEKVMERWSPEGLHVLHQMALVGRAFVHLYAGEAEASLVTLEAQSRALKGSIALHAADVRIEAIFLQATAALAAADARPSATTRFLDRASRHGKRLAGEKMSWTRALADLIRAGLACRRGRTGDALALFEEAEQGFRAHGMGLFATACRRKRGSLLGGEVGRALIEDADDWMRAQEIVNPARMATMLAP